MRAFIRTFVAISVIASATTGCTTAYKNGQQCKNKMMETYPTGNPQLSYELPSSAIHGSRVTVEATYQVPSKKPLPGWFDKKTEDRFAGVECTFDGETMKSFRWLSPKKLVSKNDNDQDDEGSESSDPDDQ